MSIEENDRGEERDGKRDGISKSERDWREMKESRDSL